MIRDDTTPDDCDGCDYVYLYYTESLNGRKSRTCSPRALSSDNVSGNDEYL